MNCSKTTARKRFTTKSPPMVISDTQKRHGNQPYLVVPLRSYIRLDQSSNVITSSSGTAAPRTLSKENRPEAGFVSKKVQALPIGHCDNSSELLLLRKFWNCVLLLIVGASSAYVVRASACGMHVI